MDATLRSLEMFKDPSQWEVVPGVPIFSAHKVVKRGPDGRQVKIEVTEGELKQIEHMARKQEQQHGVVPRITLGHMVLPKDTPESRQPPPVGFNRNLRVGRWGPEGKLGIICDQWFYKGKKPQTGDYPYRSVEYYPDTHEITGVALLRRDPELDLGVVFYGEGRIAHRFLREKPVNKQRGSPCFFYAREDDMAEPNEPLNNNEGMGPTSQPSAEAPDPEFSEHFMRCVRHHFPHLESMHKHHASHYAGGAAPAMMSPTNASIPGAAAPPAPGGEEEEAEQMMRRNFPRVYARQQVVKAENSRRLMHYTRLQNEVRLRQLVADGYPVDLNAEIEVTKDMTAAQYDAYEKTIIRHLADRRGPAQYAGIELPVAEGGRTPRQLTEADHERAMQYLRDHPGTSWEDAQKWARTNSTDSMLNPVDYPQGGWGDRQR